VCRYGGAQLCEEVSALSNECAKTCNKSRSHLEAGQKLQLDHLTVQLGELFEDASGVELDCTKSAHPDSKACASDQDAADVAWELLKVQ
jgi:hypothetical protein